MDDPAPDPPHRFIKFSPEDRESLIPLQEDITIFNLTRILKVPTATVLRCSPDNPQNIEGCVNTLSMECQHFYAAYGGIRTLSLSFMVIDIAINIVIDMVIA